MYEQYTDKQIVEMLKPKLAKLGWEPEFDPRTEKLISTLYKSGYIRGQKGRSFLIGEKKEVKAEKGAKVCWISDDRDAYYPDKKGTVGTINYVDCDGDLWVYWPLESQSWCCAKNQCLLIDTNAKGNIKKGDRIVYLGRKHGFPRDNVWPNRVATGVVDFAEKDWCMVHWDNPDVVADCYHGRTHVYYEDIAKVIPWD